MREYRSLYLHRPMTEFPAVISIVVSDDHAMFRQALRSLLEPEQDLRVIGEAADGIETMRIVSQLKPEILLLDFSLPKANGLEVLEQLSKMEIPTRTILLTADIEHEQVLEALKLGARGLVLKQSALNVLLESIRSVHAGRFWIAQGGVSDLVEAFGRTQPQASSSPAKVTQDFGLTPREKQLIALIGAGYTNKDVAKELGVSENTAKHHLTNIFDKLGVSNRLELLLFCVDHHLIGD